MCHQPGGVGLAPAFPALNRNEHLRQAELIVSNVHRGKGSMPAFPDLDAVQLADVATYIRNAWDNRFGPVSPAQASVAVRAGVAAIGPSLTIWQGVYSPAQAGRGKVAYGGFCQKCHGVELDGSGQPDQRPSPALAGDGLFFAWNGRTIGSLADYIRTKMPPDNPGVLTPAQVTDIIAYMLAVSETPSRQTDLPADAPGQADIVIRRAP